VDRRARILVVDDEVDIVTTLRTWLERELPVEVECAFSGAEGLQAMRRHRVDLVLSDYRMPGMDGLHFLRRAQELRPGVARILMTAYADIDVVMDAVNHAKASRFLRKPLQAPVLVKAIRDVLREAAEERTLGAAEPVAPGAAAED
jgi:DNA-binding NtrC family response regulator